MKPGIFLALILILALAAPLPAQPLADFFWSFENLGEGAVNSNPSGVFGVGETVTMYMYFSNHRFDIDTGVFWDVSTSQDGVIEFLASETFDFEITVSGIPIEERWTEFLIPGNGGSYGPGTVSDDGQLTSFHAFTVTGGDGMIDANTGPLFLDQGYDIEADAFLFGQIEFAATSPGTVEILAEAGPCGINCFPPYAGTATITVIPEPTAIFGFTLVFFATSLLRLGRES